MARILFFNIPLLGHISPTLPVVGELRRRGHEVTYCCTEETRPSIERSGARFTAYPDVLSRRELTGASKRIADVRPLLVRYQRQLVPFAASEIRREAPDLVVYDNLAVWAAIASGSVGVPAIASYTLLVPGGWDVGLGKWNNIWQLFDGLRARRATRREHDRMAEALGAEVVVLSQHPPIERTNIVFVGPRFHPSSTVVDDRFTLVGPSLDERTREVDDWQAPDGDGPLVYVSLGTVNNEPTAFYREVFRAYRNHPSRFVLSTGTRTDLRKLGPFPANFAVHRSVPQLRVLEAADAFVTHGGMNSIQESLSRGVPMVVVPQQLEQVINGRRVAQLGAGVVLGDQAPYGRVSAAGLRRALDEILTVEAYRRQAQQLGEDGRAAGGYVRAADTIEQELSRDRVDPVERRLT